MKTKPNLQDFKYGLIAYTLKGKKSNPYLSIIHFCGYMHPPTEEDIKMLEMELDIDEEFGLVGRINKDVFIMKATPEMVKACTSKVSEENNTVTIHK